MDVFFFNDTATTEIYTLSLHDALPISGGVDAVRRRDPQSLLDLGQQVGQRGVDLPVHPRLDVEQEIGDPRCLVQDLVSRNEALLRRSRSSSQPHAPPVAREPQLPDRKSTRLNSSHAN